MNHSLFITKRAHTSKRACFISILSRFSSFYAYEAYTITYGLSSLSPSIWPANNPSGCIDLETPSCRCSIFCWTLLQICAQNIAVQLLGRCIFEGAILIYDKGIQYPRTSEYVKPRSLANHCFKTSAWFLQGTTVSQIRPLMEATFRKFQYIVN